MEIPDEVFEIGILSKEYHERLITNLKKYAGKAGIPPKYVWSKLSQYCSDADVTWVRKMREGTDCGLIYTGTAYNVPVEDKMMAIAGACLRNFIDARMMTVQDVIFRLKDESMPYPTVILVPNFCMSKDDVSSVAPWQAAALLGWLYSRLAKNLKTVLYVGDMKTLESAYGEAMAKHLSAHYHIL